MWCPPTQHAIWIETARMVGRLSNLPLQQSNWTEFDLERINPEHTMGWDGMGSSGFEFTSLQVTCVRANPV